jgi:Tfp pilus assembly protein PilO
MRLLTSREKIIFVICIAVVAVYIINLIILRPAQGSLNHLDQLIQDEILQYQKNMRLIEKSRHLENTYRVYQDQFKQSKDNEQTMAVMLADIEREASAYNLRISDIKPKRVERLNDYNVFSVSVTLDSEFKPMVSFLHTLQSPPYLFSVDEFALDKGGVRNSSEVKTRLILRKILIP